ncbi:MAG: sigma-70 family RNA polymerase sigma factor [Phycisphaera sp.]|nr:sigma-70 family RNA polymerase sigma factor [Phycisphaera sp.]
MPISEKDMVRLLVTRRTRVISYIWTIVRDAALAEDVYQDLCIEAVEKRQTIESDEHFMNWMLRGARLRSIDSLRRRRANPVVFDDAVLGMVERDIETDKASSAELRHALDLCLEALAPDAQRLVKMRYREGLTGPQIAESLGRNLKTVYVTFTRIHRVLADCIDKRLGAEGDARA